MLASCKQNSRIWKLLSSFDSDGELSEVEIEDLFTFNIRTNNSGEVG